MIEALIDYIQKQGCNVRVEEGYLVLWKEAKGSICQLGWHVFLCEPLAQAYRQTLFTIADYKIAKLDKKIAETDPPNLEQEYG